MIYDGQLADSYQTQNAPQVTVTENRERSAPFSFGSDDARSQIDIHKFVAKLKSMSGNYSTAKCAKSVRIALQSAGAKIVSHPIAASDWGDTLTKIGYRQIQPAFDHPQKGDIYIIKRTPNHVYGHIAGYSGSQWISDFKQTSYDVYKDRNVTYSYYRPI
ncbi:hypothetical protein [Acinetobacter ihumii]|uniref:hypothetical protein n=1 Tax=Acinetobacter ihumii TaxID=2483802 RepID=UPI00103084D5|nr:hypothetical protein [Acinetobacter ihumii]